LRLRRPVSTRKALKCFWMSYAAMQSSCLAQRTTTRAAWWEGSLGGFLA
jgi:hypothetical protein